METLIVQPQNKEQLEALKAFMTALKIHFKTDKSSSKKTNSYKVPLSEKFAGSLNLSDNEYKQFQESLTEARQEWNRDF